MSHYDVVIVNYNTGDLLKEAVESVLHHSQVSKIYIVDNNSKDSSMKFTSDDCRIKKIYRKRNYGFASSCNYGAALSTHKNILFLNPDCVLLENVAPLLTDLESKKSIAVVGCLVTNKDGTEQRASRRRLPTLMRAIKTYSGLEKYANKSSCLAGVNLTHEPMPEKTVYCEAISGAFILMKKRVFSEIKGFDEAFPMHFEDLDLFKRTINSGYQIAFNPHVKVKHYQGTSSVSNPKVKQYKKQGLRLYFRKHCSYLSSVIIDSMSRFLA